MPKRVRGDFGYLIVMFVVSNNRTFVANFAAPAWDRALRVLHHERPFMASMAR